MGKIFGDRLNRDEYINNIVSIVETCARRETPTTFAIEGEWGQGKSWLINKVEAKLKNIDISQAYSLEQYEKTSSQYFIVHYNAWEKDYYEEPLLAILSAIVKELNNQLASNHVLTTLNKKVAREILVQLEFVFDSVSKKLFGFSMVTISKKIAKEVKKIKSESEIKLRTQNSNDNIDNDIQLIISILNQLSKIMPIIFVVDELDRCVPTFAVKTLERLHHIFDKINYSVTILSVSKKQLDRSVDKLYGDGSSEQYFKKYFDFSIKLNFGKVDVTEVDRKLEEFSHMFDKKRIESQGEELVNKICESLLSREFENIIDRAILCHNLIGEDTSTFPRECMIAEILLQAYWNICEREGNTFNISPENGNTPSTSIGKTMKDYLKRLNKLPIYSWEADDLIAYVLAIVLDYKIYRSFTFEKNSSLIKQLDDYYKKYATFFYVIKIS